MEVERNELKKNLPPCYELYRYEDDRARRTSPQQYLLELIRQADAFVGILGPDYGSTFTADAAQKSIVEWEFDTAIEERGLEVLAFIKNVIPGESPDPRQQAFINRVCNFTSGLWCKRFSTATEFAEFVHAALERLLIAKWNEVQQKLARLQLWARRALLLIAGLSVFVLIVLTASSLESLFSTRSMIAFSAAVVFLVLSCAVLSLKV